MNILLVVNPVSGGINKEPFLRDATAFCNKYNIGLTVFRTTGDRDDQALKKIISKNSPDKIAVAGGDGTVRFVVINLLNSGMPIGIIPLGSANGLATDFGVSQNPMQAFNDLVVSEFFMPIDVIKINDKYISIHLGDVGINAAIVSRYERAARHGKMAYARYFIKEVVNKKPFEVRVETDNEAYGREIIMLAICNARKFGTGVPLNLTGTPDDGRFELVLLERFDVKGMIRAGLSKFNERFHDSAASTILDTRQATVHLAHPQTLQLDGEVIGKFKQLKIEVVPGAFKLISHRNNPYILDVSR